MGSSKTDEQAQLNKLKADYNKLVAEGREDEEGSKALLEKINNLFSEINKSAESRVKLAKEELENTTENLEIMKEIAAINGDQAGIQDALIEQAEMKVQLGMEELGALTEKAKKEKEEHGFISQALADEIKQK